MRVSISNSTKYLSAAAVLFGLLAINADYGVAQTVQTIRKSRYRFVDSPRKSEQETVAQAQQGFIEQSAFETQPSGLAPILESEDAPRLGFEDSPAQEQRPVQDIATLPSQTARQVSNQLAPIIESNSRARVVADQARMTGPMTTQTRYDHQPQLIDVSNRSPLIRNSIKRQTNTRMTLAPKVNSPRVATPAPAMSRAVAQRGTIENTDYHQTQSTEFADGFDSYEQDDTYDTPATAQMQAEPFYDAPAPTFMDDFPEPIHTAPFRDQFKSFERRLDYRAGVYAPGNPGPQHNIFGIAPSECCNEWEGFCGCKPIENVCGCGGLKQNPGHLGLKWLGSKEACDSTQRCGCSLRSGCGKSKGSRGNGCSSGGCSGSCSGSSSGLLKSRTRSKHSLGGLFSTPVSNCNCGQCAQTARRSSNGCDCGSCN